MPGTERTSSPLAGAWKVRGEAGGGRGEPVVVPLRGGRGALVSRAAARRLVTTVAASDTSSPSTGIAGWLERRQAGRSAIIVVPDRATGVALALRWRLDPQRFRLAEGFDVANAGLSMRGSSAVAWHSKG